MRYMLLIYHDEADLTAPEYEKCYEESLALAKDLAARGCFISANPLHPVSTATTVRVRDGKRLVVDGPFAETREKLGGYFLVTASNLDEVLEIAERIPVARYGSVEVRPVMQMDGLP